MQKTIVFKLMMGFIVVFTLLPIKAFAQESKRFRIKSSPQLGLSYALNFENKYGFLDENDNTTIPFVYDYAENFTDKDNDQNGRATVAINGKFGSIDAKGKIIIPLEYDYVEEVMKGYIIVQKKGRWGICDKMGKIIIPLEYNYISPWLSRFNNVAAVKNDKWGVIKLDNTVLVPFDYSLIITDFGGLGQYTAYADLSKAGILIDPDGIILKNGEESFQYTEDLQYKVTGTGKLHGLKDKKGTTLLPSEYVRVNQLKDKMPYFEVYDGEFIGLYDAITKQFILPIKYAGISMAGTDIFSVASYITEDKVEYRFYDKMGKRLFDKVFDDVFDFDFKKKNFAIVQKGNKWGAIDRNGNEVLKFEYSTIRNGEGNKIIACKKTGWGIMDEQFNILLPFKFSTDAFLLTDLISGDIPYPFLNWDMGSSLSSEYAVIKDINSGDFGVLKKDLSWAIPLGKYGYISEVRSNVFTKKQVRNLVDVTEKGSSERRKFNLDKQQFIIPVKHSMSSEHTDTSYYSILRTGSSFYSIYFTEEQEHYFSNDYEYDHYCKETENFIVRKPVPPSGFEESFKYGIVDKKGNAVTSFIYDNLKHTLFKDYFYARKGEKVGIIDSKGAVLLPFKYDYYYTLNSLNQKEENYQLFTNEHIMIKEGENNILFDTKFSRISDTKNNGEPTGTKLGIQSLGNMQAIHFYNRKDKQQNELPDLLLYNDEMYEQPVGGFSPNGADNDLTASRFKLDNGMLLCKKNGKYGFLDYAGKEVVPFEYDKASSFDVMGVAAVKKNNQWYTINRLGERLNFLTLTAVILSVRKK